MPHSLAAATGTRGASSPLGATPYRDGTNFSLFSRHAAGVELLLFDRALDAQPARAIRLDPVANRTYHYWHAFVPGLRPAKSTATGSTGRRAPANGMRFDPAKLLLDPYGRAVVVPEGYCREAARRPGDNDGHRHEERGGRPAAYDWEGDAPLRRPSARTIIYEMHVRGFTRIPAPGCGETTRGTYAGLIEKIPYLQQLGITAVELLPVFQFDAQDCPPGLVNYWGYCAGLVLRAAPGLQLAPGPAGPGRRVSRHGQGAAPGGHRGHSRRRLQPHRRGRRARADALLPRLDNAIYYMLERRPVAVRQLHRLRQHAQRQPSDRAPHDPRQPALLGGARCTSTGSGSTSHRSWRAIRRATPLPNPPVLWDIESDPVLAGTKLIAEAWDAAGLYQVGSFVGDALEGVERPVPRRRPPASSAATPGSVGDDVADRLVGSPDLYGHEQRERRAEHQLRHLPRRLHAERPGLLQREAQRGQRRRQPRRHQRQPQLELRRRGADRRSRRSRRCATGRSRTS